MSSIRKKLVIVGDGECGKTSLLSMFCNDEFPKDYIPTIFDTKVIEVHAFNRIVNLELWDTAGQEDYDRLRPLSYPDTNVIIMCYAINSMDSLYNIEDRWIHEVKHFCPNTPIILIGNKVDLRNNLERLKVKNFQENPVTYEEGRQMADFIKAYGFFECSALDNINVQETFYEATKAALFPKCLKKRLCRIL